MSHVQYHISRAGDKLQDAVSIGCAAGLFEYHVQDEIVRRSEVHVMGRLSGVLGDVLLLGEDGVGNIRDGAVGHSQAFEVVKRTGTGVHKIAHAAVEHG